MGLTVAPIQNGVPHGILKGKAADISGFVLRPSPLSFRRQTKGRFSDMFDIPPILFFQSKNPFTGSRGRFRFRIEPGESLHVSIWEGPYCFEKSEILETNDFPLDAEGREAMLAWLEEKSRQLQAE